MQTRRIKVIYWLRHRIGRAQMILNRRRSHVYIDWRKKKIVISERYQKKIKVTSRIILLISVVASFVTLPPPYSVLLSLGLIIIEQLLERVVYSFLSVLIVPFPDFSLWRKANFIAMIFARAGSADLPRVGMAFGDQDAAKEVWSYIEDWNYGSSEDPDNNVCVSLVVNKKAGAYALFVYPNYFRPTVQAAKEQFQQGKEDKEQQMHVGQMIMCKMIMCKVFPLKNSGFEKVFLPQYKPGEEYLFECWIMGNPPKGLEGTIQIRKKDLKIIDYDKLTRKDLEYHMAKYSIEWHNPDPNRESMFYVGDPDKRV